MNSRKETIKQIDLHSNITLSTDGVLHIPRYEARQDDLSYKAIDLNRFLLPPNTLYKQQQKLLEQPQFIMPALHAISEFSNSAPESKSKANRIAYMLSCMVKFLEYLWLNDVYRLPDAPSGLISQLPKTLAQGGWHSALKIPERINSFLATAQDPTHSLFSSYNWKVSLSSIGFQSAIGTNITSKETAIYFKQIQEFRKLRGWPSTEHATHDQTIKGLKYSLLRQTLESINYLYQVPDHLRLPRVPYPEYVRMAKKLTAPPGRTKNIDGYGAGMLVEKSLHYIYDRSDGILSFLAAVLDLLSQDLEPNIKSHLITKAATDANISDMFKNPLFGKNTVKTAELNNLLRNLLTACFVSIAVFNARRRDEIAHPKLGLFLGCCTPYSLENKIYELKIYIEKTRKEHVPFYVGNATYKAVEILEKISLIQSYREYTDHACGALTEPRTTLFRYKTFTSTGLTEKFSCYTFSAFKGGQAHNFMRNLGVTFTATPHMFRRLYCTIFINQHEYPHLPALSHQLQHDNWDTTQIYITGPVTQADAALLSRVYDWNINDYNETHVSHNEALAVELAAAAREKLSEIIYSIFSGAGSSGGYAKFITTLYKRLNRIVTFEITKERERLELFIDTLATRGHSPRPYGHGQCLAFDIKLKTSSRCYEKNDNTLHKENASPTLCKNCPYSWTSPAHIKNLDLKLIAKTNNAALFRHNSVLRIALDENILKLRQTIDYHKNGITKK